MFLRVNHDVFVKGDTELAGGELLRIDIGDLDGSFGSLCRDDLDGNDYIDADSCGQDIIQVVVDVLANDVYTARTACNEIGLLAIGFGELFDEILPASFYLRGHRLRRDIVCCVDVCDVFGLRNKELLRGHCCGSGGKELPAL